MSRRLVISILWLRAAAALLVAPAPALAQIASIVGTIRDPAGDPLPGTSIEVTNEGTGRRRLTTSEADGGFQMTTLPPGKYRLVVSLDGYRQLVREGVTVPTGDTVRVELAMHVGAVSEAVTVTADAPLLRSATSGLGQVVSREKIDGMSLNGRSFISLAALAPGVALPPGSSLPRINGGRPRTNEYLFDGISVLQPEPGQVALFPASTPSRNSRSRATPRRRSSGASTAASSTSRPHRDQRVARQRLRVLPQ